MYSDVSRTTYSGNDPGKSCVFDRTEKKRSYALERQSQPSQMHGHVIVKLGDQIRSGDEQLLNRCDDAAKFSN